MQLTSLKARQILYESHSGISTVYFPLGAVASELSTMADGTTVEIATIGKEGMLGVPLLLGSETTLLGMIAQIPGPALAMTREDFKATVNVGASSLLPILLRYTQALLTQVAQQSACNRSHVIAKRCARWILMTHDRVQKAGVSSDARVSGLYVGSPEGECVTGREQVSPSGFDQLHQRQHPYSQSKAARKS